LKFKRKAVATKKENTAIMTSIARTSHLDRNRFE
jgi:hypothetical protein